VPNADLILMNICNTEIANRVTKPLNYTASSSPVCFRIGLAVSFY